MEPVQVYCPDRVVTISPEVVKERQEAVNKVLQNVPMCTNKRVYLGFQEDSKATHDRVKKAGVRRAKLIDAVVNAVHTAMLPRPIQRAWEVSHLFPFQPEPPGSEKDEIMLQKQIMDDEKKFLLDKQNAEPNPLRPIGVITSEETFQSFSAALEQRQEAQRQKQTKTVSKKAQKRKDNS